MTAPIYFDASVLTSLSLGDETAGRIFASLVPEMGLPIISELAWGEFVAALAARVRTRTIRIDTAKQLMTAARRDLLTGQPLLLATSDIAEATSLIEGFSLTLKLPDAIHVVVARRLGATLISTDRQQVAAARTLHVDCINPLEVAR